MSTPVSTTAPATTVEGGVGQSARRPDGRLKVTGEFAFSSDLWADDMLWGRPCAARTPGPGCSAST